jgi:hypothetical protein
VTTTEPPRLITFACPCMRCGYDLMGLPIEGRCPECGTPARATYAGRRIVDAPRPWVRTIASGATLVGASVWVWSVGLGLSIVVGAVVWVALHFGALMDWRLPSRIVAGIAVASGAVGLLGLLIGGERLTRAEPDAVDDDERRSSRRRARELLLAITAAVLVGGPAIALLRLLGLSGDVFFLTVDAAFLAGGVGFTLTMIVGASWLGELALRLPQGPLALRLRVRVRRLALLLIAAASTGALTVFPFVDLDTALGPVLYAALALLVLCSLAASLLLARSLASLAVALRSRARGGPDPSASQ